MSAETLKTAKIQALLDETRRFLASEGRGEDWVELVADDGVEYDRTEEIDLSTLEPLVALASSTDRVEVAVVQGSAARKLRATVGTPVTIGWAR